MAMNLISPVLDSHNNLMKLVVIPILSVGKLRIRIFT